MLSITVKYTTLSQLLRPPGQSGHMVALIGRLSCTLEGEDGDARDACCCCWVFPTDMLRGRELSTDCGPGVRWPRLGDSVIRIRGDSDEESHKELPLELLELARNALMAVLVVISCWIKPGFVNTKYKAVYIYMKNKIKRTLNIRITQV